MSLRDPPEIKSICRVLTPQFELVAEKALSKVYVEIGEVILYSKSGGVGAKMEGAVTIVDKAPQDTVIVCCAENAPVPEL